MQGFGESIDVAEWFGGFCDVFCPRDRVPAAAADADATADDVDEEDEPEPEPPTGKRGRGRPPAAATSRRNSPMVRFDVDDI